MDGQECKGYGVHSNQIPIFHHGDPSERGGPLAGFVFRVFSGQYGAVLPGELGHTPLEDFNLRWQEEPGPPSPTAGMEGGALKGANLHRPLDYGTRAWPRPGSHSSLFSFTVGRLRVDTLNVRGLTTQDLDNILIRMRDEVIDAAVLTDTHSTGPEVNFWKAQVRQCLGPNARLYSADSHRLPSRRSDSDRVAVGGCMIINDDA